MSLLLSPSRRRPIRAIHTRKFIELLEDRRLFADGISAVGGPEIFGTAGVPITNALVADFTITDSSGSPGTQWDSQIDWGDGTANTKKDPAIADPSIAGQFDFLASHTFAAPGIYSMDAMIAIPGSHDPNGNTVTLTADISAVPEPASAAILLLGTSLVLARRQRRENEVPDRD